MKKLFILVALLAITATASAQLKVLQNGNVAIGHNNPTYKLDVKGSARFSLWGQSWDNVFMDGDNPWGSPQLYCKTLNFRVGTPDYLVASVNTKYLNSTLLVSSSDEDLKENIKPLGGMLNKLLEVEAKRYNYKKDTVVSAIPDFEALLEKEMFGFVAQELERVFPELVYPPSNVNKYYSVNYTGMIPVLLEAIKEQQAQIEQQQKEVKVLQEIIFSQEIDLIDMKELRKVVDKLQEVVNTCCEHNGNLYIPDTFEEGQIPQNRAILYQNIPNPFSSNTEIKCQLPESAKHAILYIYNLQGAELESYAITQTGINTITVYGSELPAGMYLYTLVVDNEIIDTKRMILTK